MGDDRRLTLIVVPHGDLETRTFDVSYGRLKFYLFVVVALVAAVALVLALWFPIFAQAARVPGLEQELAQLESERDQVTELARTLAEVEAQYERVRQLLGADAPAGGGQPSLPPLRAEPDTAADASGAARDDAALLPKALQRWPLDVRGYITRAAAGGNSHPGIDVAVARGSLIRAAGDGIVRIAGMDDVYGYYVVVDHGADVQTLYGHADTLLVEAGRRVIAGAVLARTGSSGRSSAPHLHFEVRSNGRSLDPLRFIQPEANR
jgi:murein DD-endopeptidase MepM/ murein hydrolase activator NlpD